MPFIISPSYVSSHFFRYIYLILENVLSYTIIRRKSPTENEGSCGVRRYKTNCVVISHFLDSWCDDLLFLLLGINFSSYSSFSFHVFSFRALFMEIPAGYQPTLPWTNMTGNLYNNHLKMSVTLRPRTWFLETWLSFQWTCICAQNNWTNEQMALMVM